LYLGFTRPTIPNGISIASAVFAGLTVVTMEQTDRQIDGHCDHDTTAAPIADAAMRLIVVVNIISSIEERVYRLL